MFSFTTVTFSGSITGMCGAARESSAKAMNRFDDSRPFSRLMGFMTRYQMCVKCYIDTVSDCFDMHYAHTMV